MPRKVKRPANPAVWWHLAECAAWSIICSLTKTPAKRRELFFKTVRLDRPDGAGVAAGVKAKGHG